MSGSSCEAGSQGDRGALKVALVLNTAMFVIGAVAGVLAQSTSLIADALDMLADASAYAIALIAIGRTDRFKAVSAIASGVVLLALGAGVLIEVIHRMLYGSTPESLVIIGVAALSLLVNAIVLRMLGRFRAGQVHLRAAWIFTRADVIANIGVIASGILVALTGERYPDLVAGTAIGIYVIREAFEILSEARESQPEP